MTLNITYADSAAVYQSSDYRLTYANGSATDTTFKHLSISLLGPPRWCATLSYTGVGQFAGTDVMKSLGERIESASRHRKLTPDDHIELIQHEATSFVRKYSDRRLFDLD